MAPSRSNSLRASFIAVIGVCAFSVACDLSIEKPVTLDAPRRAASTAIAIAGGTHIPMLDELLEEVNRRAPGFGGMFWSARGVLTINVTPKGSFSGIEAAVRTVFSDLPWSTVTSVRFATARFEVLELQAHRAKLSQVASGSLIWSDLDERANVVRVGVEETADIATLSGLMRASGATDGAVVFEHSKKFVSAQYLTSTHRPTVGGVQIELRDSVIRRLYGQSASALCSLGLNVGVSTDEAHKYFMTAGHCTESAFSNVGALVYQPDSITNPSAIGYEVANPDARTGIGSCPSGYTCKYSDAALFKYYGGGLSNFAYLAKDSSFSSTLGVSGSLFRVDSFHVVSDFPESSLLAADTVNYDTWMHKVGRTTGWTFGPVVRSCVTFYYTSNKALLCQYGVAAQAAGGDSGSPAFSWICCANSVELGGLVIAAIPGQSYLFSSITGIKNDFANLVSY